ncbi:hypothetical protein [Hymenobacter saemangeumensis]
MSFLDKLVSSGTALFAKKYPDYSYGLIDRLGVDAMLRQQRWEALEATVMGLDSEDLTRLLDGLCLTDKYEDALRSYLAASSSEVRQLVAGAYHLYLAWARRTGSYGAALTEKQIEGFLHFLHEANNDFSRNFSTPVLEAESFARLVRVYMGFSEVEAAESSFANAVHLVPTHLLAHLNYFRTSTPRWLGSAEALHDYVSQVEDDRLRRLLQLMFLIEMYSDLQNENRSTATATFREQHGELISEVLGATALPADDSLLTIYTRNYLACLYRILGQSQQEAALKKQLEGRRTSHPWIYFGW